MLRYIPRSPFRTEGVIPAMGMPIAFLGQPVSDNRLEMIDMAV